MQHPNYPTEPTSDAGAVIFIRALDEAEKRDPDNSFVQTLRGRLLSRGFLTAGEFGALLKVEHRRAPRPPICRNQPVVPPSEVRTLTRREIERASGGPPPYRVIHAHNARTVGEAVPDHLINEPGRLDRRAQSNYYNQLLFAAKHALGLDGPVGENAGDALDRQLDGLTEPFDQYDHDSAYGGD